MANRSAREVVTAAVCGGLLLATGIGLLQRLQPHRLLSRLRASLKSARQRLASFQEASDDEVGLLVQAKMRQWKVDHVQWCFHALCVSLSPMTALILYYIAMDQPRTNTLAQDVIQLVMHGLFLLVVIHPGAVTWKTIDVFCGTLMLAGAVYTSPWCCSASTALMSILFTTGIAVLLNTARRSVLVSAVFNSVLALSVMGTLMAHGKAILDRPHLLAVWELTALTLFPTLAYTLDVSMGMGLRSSLEMQATKEILSAASALLRSCCDVVVELSANGVITCPAKDLGGFLLRGPDCSLKNTHLADLIPDENDKRMFIRKLTEKPPEGVGLAEAIHVGMRDVNNVQLKVEILSFQFRHLDSQPRYMIGLREFSDVPVTGRRRQQRQQDFDASNPDAAEGSSEEADEEPSSRSSSANTDNAAEFDAATLMVDSTSLHLPVRGCSAKFQMRIGRLGPGTCLRDLVNQSDEFYDWLHMAAQYGSDWPEINVVFNLRQGKFRAKCRVEQDTTDEAIDRERVQLGFRNIKRCRSHSDGCSGFRPHTNFRGTPVLHVAL